MESRQIYNARHGVAPKEWEARDAAGRMARHVENELQGGRTAIKEDRVRLAEKERVLNDEHQALGRSMQTEVSERTQEALS